VLILSHPGFNSVTALSMASFDNVILLCLSLQFGSLQLPQKSSWQHVKSGTPVAFRSAGMSEPPSHSALCMVIFGIFCWLHISIGKLVLV